MIEGPTFQLWLADAASGPAGRQVEGVTLFAHRHEPLVHLAARATSLLFSTQHQDGLGSVECPSPGGTLSDIDIDLGREDSVNAARGGDRDSVSVATFVGAGGEGLTAGRTAVPVAPGTSLPEARLWFRTEPGAKWNFVAAAGPGARVAAALSPECDQSGSRMDQSDHASTGTGTVSTVSAAGGPQQEVLSLQVGDMSVMRASLPQLLLEVRHYATGNWIRAMPSESASQASSFNNVEHDRLRHHDQPGVHVDPSDASLSEPSLAHSTPSSHRDLLPSAMESLEPATSSTSSSLQEDEWRQNLGVDDPLDVFDSDSGHWREGAVVSTSMVTSTISGEGEDPSSADAGFDVLIVRFRGQQGHRLTTHRNAGAGRSTLGEKFCPSHGDIAPPYSHASDWRSRVRAGMEIEVLVSHKRCFFCPSTGLVLHCTDNRWWLSHPIFDGCTAVEAVFETEVKAVFRSRQGDDISDEHPISSQSPKNWAVLDRDFDQWRLCPHVTVAVEGDDVVHIVVDPSHVGGPRPEVEIAGVYTVDPNQNWLKRQVISVDATTRQARVAHLVQSSKVEYDSQWRPHNIKRYEWKPLPGTISLDSDTTRDEAPGSAFRQLRTLLLSRSVSEQEQTNLDGVHHNLDSHVVGLPNLGNTCYMNSVLQCLLSVPEIAHAFADPRLLVEGEIINTQSAMSNAEHALNGPLDNPNSSKSSDVDQETHQQHAARHAADERSGTGGLLARALCGLVRKVARMQHLSALDKDSNMPVEQRPPGALRGAPLGPLGRFKAALDQFCPEFRALHSYDPHGRQHDAMQATQIILDLLHHDLNLAARNTAASEMALHAQASPRSHSPSKAMSQLPPKIQADHHWQHHRQCDRSVIADAFQMQQRSRLSWDCKCSGPSGHHVSYVFDVTNSLALPLHFPKKRPESSGGSGKEESVERQSMECLCLSASLDHYLASETPEGVSRGCKHRDGSPDGDGNRDAEGCGADACPVHKKLDLCRLAPVLCFQLKRYRQNVLGEMQKIEEVVQFPMEIFMDEYLVDYDRAAASRKATDAAALIARDKSITTGTASSELPSPSPDLASQDGDEDDEDELLLAALRMSTAGSADGSDVCSSDDDCASPPSATASAGEPLSTGDLAPRSTWLSGTLLYELVAVSNQHGTLNGGHYTAFAKRGLRWFRCNDSKVTALPGWAASDGDTNQDQCQICNKDAYLLFYRRVPPENMVSYLKALVQSAHLKIPLGLQLYDHATREPTPQLRALAWRARRALLAQAEAVETAKQQAKIAEAKAAQVAKATQQLREDVSTARDILSLDGPVSESQIQQFRSALSRARALGVQDAELCAEAEKILNEGDKKLQRDETILRAMSLDELEDEVIAAGLNLPVRPEVDASSDSEEVEYRARLENQARLAKARATSAVAQSMVLLVYPPRNFVHLGPGSNQQLTTQNPFAPYGPALRRLAPDGLTSKNAVLFSVALPGRALQELSTMGFAKDERTIEALAFARGNIPEAVNSLVRDPEVENPELVVDTTSDTVTVAIDILASVARGVYRNQFLLLTNPFDPEKYLCTRIPRTWVPGKPFELQCPRPTTKLATLRDRGFTDEKACLEALRCCGGSVLQAARVLEKELRDAHGIDCAELHQTNDAIGGGSTSKNAGPTPMSAPASPEMIPMDVPAVIGARVGDVLRVVNPFDNTVQYARIPAGWDGVSPLTTYVNKPVAKLQAIRALGLTKQNYPEADCLEALRTTFGNVSAAAAFLEQQHKENEGTIVWAYDVPYGALAHDKMLLTNPFTQQKFSRSLPRTYLPGTLWHVRLPKPLTQLDALEKVLLAAESDNNSTSGGAQKGLVGDPADRTDRDDPGSSPQARIPHSEPTCIAALGAAKGDVMVAAMTLSAWSGLASQLDPIDVRSDAADGCLAQRRCMEALIRNGQNIVNAATEVKQLREVRTLVGDTAIPDESLALLLRRYDGVEALVAKLLAVTQLEGNQEHPNSGSGEGLTEATDAFFEEVRSHAEALGVSATREQVNRLVQTHGYVLDSVVGALFGS